jgi:hypothetical protein
LKEIRSEIEINAPASEIWNVLVDFEHYQDWNPFIYKASGAAVPGRKIEIWVRTPSGKERKYSPIVTKVEDGLELRWLGKSFFLEGEHTFSLLKVDQGSTKLVQTEVFKGLLAGFFGENTDRDIFEGFRRMNEALKGKIERSG